MNQSLSDDQPPTLLSTTQQGATHRPDQQCGSSIRQTEDTEFGYEPAHGGGQPCTEEILAISRNQLFQFLALSDPLTRDWIAGVIHPVDNTRET